MQKILLLLAMALFIHLGVVKTQAAPDISVDFFYDQLGDYGDWVEVGDYGYGWQPRDVGPDWRPYSDGRRAYTEAGWITSIRPPTDADAPAKTRLGRQRCPADIPRTSPPRDPCGRPFRAAVERARPKTERQNLHNVAPGNAPRPAPRGEAEKPNPGKGKAKDEKKPKEEAPKAQ